jgi:hypothetical protein
VVSSGDGRTVFAFRSTAGCRRLLASLAQNRGISQAAALEILVRDEAERRNLEAESRVTA